MKNKSDLEKWHEEYRKKHPEWKERREERRRKEIGIEDEETQSSILEKAKAFFGMFIPNNDPNKPYSIAQLIFNLIIILIIIGVIAAIVKIFF